MSIAAGITMNGATATRQAAWQNDANRAEGSGQGLTTEKAFQQFVAGTFYSQMLKAMRSTQGEVQYLGGGQAEDVFRSQLDQQLADQLAKDHGAPLAAPLFPAFEAARSGRINAGSSQIDYSA